MRSEDFWNLADDIDSASKNLEIAKKFVPEEDSHIDTETSNVISYPQVQLPILPELQLQSELTSDNFEPEKLQTKELNEEIDDPYSLFIASNNIFEEKQPEIRKRKPWESRKKN